MSSVVYLGSAGALVLCLISAYASGSYFVAIAGVLGVVCVLVLPGFVFQTKKKPALHKTEWSEYPLIDKKQITHNTFQYRFALDSKDQSLGLPIGQHVSIAATIGGKEVVRSYTPVSTEADLGYFDLLIKTYPTGMISKYVHEMSIGQKIKVRGPKGFFVYEPNMVRSFGMIAGGTGITPMMQIIKAVLSNPADKTEISLLFANVEEIDILLKDELDDLASKHPQFKVYYVLNKPPENWTGGVGFVTKDMIKERLPAYASDTKILICGPPPMVKAMQTHCEELGYPKAQVVSKANDAIFKF
ncbi:NADH-cytochrome b5 reductase [Quaeritorhiza haematococci]|nr:NADH-cytochrome b5 reductase [Quaeritorhiza haematococci]